MNNIGQEFWQRTKYQHLSESDENKEIAPPARTLEPAASEVFSLTEPENLDLPEKSTDEAIISRRSRRSFQDTPLTKSEISALLYHTQGIKQKLPGEKSLRTVPSAGARHALETFIYLHKTADFPRGLYHYRAENHELALLRQDNLLAEVYQGVLQQKFIRQAGAVFFWATDIYRMAWRYSERAYRYVLLDAGHVCQNLYLLGEVLNIGVCAIAAYNDDYLNDFLNLDGDKQFVVYAAAAGSRKKS